MRWLTLEKVERSSYFQILLEEWWWDLFPETRFEDNLFIPSVKYPHLGNRQALAVQLFNCAWLDGGWPSYGHAILHFLSASTTLWCWQEVSNLANQKVYQILVYRHELININFRGVPLSSSSVSPRFFPLFRSLSFSLALHCLNAWNRLTFRSCQGSDHPRYM